MGDGSKTFGWRANVGSSFIVMGVPSREVNSEVVTIPRLKVEDKDRVNNSRRIKTVKLNIIKLNALLN